MQMGALHFSARMRYLSWQKPAFPVHFCNEEICIAWCNAILTFPVSFTSLTQIWACGTPAAWHLYCIALHGIALHCMPFQQDPFPNGTSHSPGSEWIMYNDDSIHPRNVNAIDVQGNASTSVFSFSLVWYGELLVWRFIQCFDDA
jgi:hypothetical protein